MVKDIDRSHQGGKGLVTRTLYVETDRPAFAGVNYEGESR
jgi:hypothetical protein